MLCGVAVPHDKGLAGHSDADVGIHALCDAIYGALAEGDIGRHFPPREAAWKDADSARFLAHAAERIAARGGRLANADVTLICERPKIAPHAAAMVARLAAMLGVDPARISVKATTTEKLGFTGRGEGIAAQAVATVLLPGLRRTAPMKRCCRCRRRCCWWPASSPAAPGAHSTADGRNGAQAAGQRGALIWQPGHWDWTGSSYVWVPGQYVDRDGPQQTLDARLLGEDRVGWVWRPAHWM